MTSEWPTPSPRVRELFRRGAEVALQPPPEWLEELHAAALAGPRMRLVADDPVLAEAARRANVANLLQWAAANVERPGVRVSATVSNELLGIARDLVRRGLDQTTMDGYRTGQNVAWRRWITICFDLTSDPVELRELLDLSSLSISAYVDDTIEAVSARIEAEREELTRGTAAERRAAVELLLRGAPIGRATAEEQLGYALTGSHTAAVVWGPAGTPPEELEAAAEALLRVSGAPRRLTVVASAAALWLWLPVATAPASTQTATTLTAHPDVRIAVGRSGRDVEGFRSSHHDAVTTQRMVARLTSVQQLARYEDVQLVALMTVDPAQSDEFVADTLGALATCEPETREVVRTWLREQCNTSRTADRLYTHRNTVVRRLARADELLPRPLADNHLHVAAALEVLHWRGAPT